MPKLKGVRFNSPLRTTKEKLNATARWHFYFHPVHAESRRFSKVEGMKIKSSMSCFKIFERKAPPAGKGAAEPQRVKGSQAIPLNILLK